MQTFKFARVERRLKRAPYLCFLKQTFSVFNSATLLLKQRFNIIKHYFNSISAYRSIHCVFISKSSLWKILLDYIFSDKANANLLYLI